MAGSNEFTVWMGNGGMTPGTYPAESGFSAGNPIYAADFNNLLRAYSLLAVALGQKFIPGVNASSSPIGINTTLQDILSKLNWFPNELISDGLAWHNLQFKFTKTTTPSGGLGPYTATSVFATLQFLYKNIAIDNSTKLFTALQDVAGTQYFPCGGAYSFTEDEAGIPSAIYRGALNYLKITSESPLNISFYYLTTDVTGTAPPADDPLLAGQNTSNTIHYQNRVHLITGADISDITDNKIIIFGA